MKTFENINQLERDETEYPHLDRKEKARLIGELRRVVQDLIPLRKSAKATEAYYNKYLCPTDYRERAREWEKMKQNLVMSLWSELDPPSQNEVSFPEDVFHPALIKVLKDDRYSFGYVYKLLCSRANRVAGVEIFKDYDVSEKVVEYAVEFDIEDLYSTFNKLDLVDSLDYLDIRLIESRKFDDDNGNEVLAELKKQFEDVAEYIKDLTNKRYYPLVEAASDSSSPVKHVPQYVDADDYDASHYLSYYNFSACSIDVSQYPFSVRLEKCKIVRTGKGLEDSSHILVMILRNAYKQVGFASGDAAEDIYNDTRALLRELSWSFYGDCLNCYGGDFDMIVTATKWWTAYTSRCLDSAFSNDVLPKSNTPFPGSNIPNFRLEVWKNCNFFRKTMNEYCIYLAVNKLREIPFNPYKAIYTVVPFNYYGDDYQKVVDSARRKRLKTEKDREATDFLANCKNLRPYLEKRLSIFDGKQINDSAAVDEKHRIVTDLIEMANSYLTHLEDDGISDSNAMKYAFESWVWIVQGMMNCIIRGYLRENTRRLSALDMDSEGDAEYMNNTGRQYVSFYRVYNTQMVQVQRDFHTSDAPPKKEESDKITPITAAEIDEICQLDEGDLNKANKSSEIQEKKEFYARGMATINVGVIFKHISSLIKTSLTEADFAYAIKYADFSVLRKDGADHRAKDYPLLIIYKLKDLFDDDWYYACCQSLQMEPTRVSGYHKEGKILTLQKTFPGNLTIQ